MKEFLLELAHNYDFVSAFLGHHQEEHRMVNQLMLNEISCPTCSSCSLSEFKCPKILDACPLKFYVYKSEGLPYVRFFENMYNFHIAHCKANSILSTEAMTNIWSNRGSVTLVCPRNVEEFIAPIRNIQIQFHPGSTVYNNYDILIERMTQFHKNVWIDSPYMGNGIKARILEKYPDAINSPILREIINREVKCFSVAQDRILTEICVETAFPRVVHC